MGFGFKISKGDFILSVVTCVLSSPLFLIPGQEHVWETFLKRYILPTYVVSSVSSRTQYCCGSSQENMEAFGPRY